MYAWFTSTQQRDNAKPEGGGGGGDLRRSSAALRRLLDSDDHYLSGSGGRGSSLLAPGLGWSRADTVKLVRMQAIVRGWLMRRKVCHIPVRDVERLLKDIQQKDKGLRRLLGYLLFFLLFFVVVLLESDVTFQHSVETGITNFINQVGAGPDDIRLSDIYRREDFSKWAMSLFLSMYDGTELEDACNTCAIARAPRGHTFFPEISESVWGTDVPLPGNGSLDSFQFEFDNCPLCYGPEGLSIAEGSSLGEDFCGAVCSGVGFCFEDRCAGYDEVKATLGQVKGTNESLVRVFSNADCSNTIRDTGYPSGFGASVGSTEVIANHTIEGAELLQLQRTGRGYVANKNKMIGALLMEWTYYEERACDDDIYGSSFYTSCFEDSGSWNNRTQSVRESLMNPFSSFTVRQGDGLVYSVAIDTGLFNSGLNLNLCRMMGVLDGVDVMTDAVRTFSLRFNTYNGQQTGLFASVDITAKFSLGGEVQLTPNVEVFLMSDFFVATPAPSARAAATILFTIILIYYTVEDLRRFLRELKDGRQHLKIPFSRVPITAATVVHLVGDCVFLANLSLWVLMAISASKFNLTEEITLGGASDQVQNLSNELLSIVAVESLKHDALAVAGGMFGLARLFLMLRFHPRLSLVTDVLAASAVHLVHFFIMFFVVVGVYSNLCWVIFGPSSSLFATWTSSFLTMTRIALGEFDNFYPGMVSINPASAFIIIATYQTLQFILLLNIVISILLGAFQMLQDRNANQATDTLQQTLATTVGRGRIRLGNSLSGVLGGKCRPLRRALKTHVVQPANGLHLSSNRQREMDSPSSISAIHISSTATTAPVQYTRNTRGGGAKISPTGNASLRRPSSNSSSLKREGSPPAGETGSSSTNITANHGNNFYNGNGRGNGSGNGRSNGSANGRDRGSRNGGNNHSDRAARIRTRAGLTRGERIVATHRYYSMHEAAEVLRRSPLPEGVVWKKMRQIVWARLGRVPALESGGGITNSRSNGTEIGMKSQKYR